MDDTRPLASGPSVPEKQKKLSIGSAWHVVIIACVARAMIEFDIAVVGISLPSIQRGLDLEMSGMLWVVNSYTLIFGGLLLLGGRISDLFGRREVFLAGLWLFTLGSFLGGFAQTDWQLILARASHGVSGAILLPATLSLILANYPDQSRKNRAIVIWGAVGVAGGTSGAVLGGVLAEHLGWRSVLFVVLPVGCALLVYGSMKLARKTVIPAKISSLDLPGALTAVGGIGAVIYAVMGLEDHAWASVHTLGWFGTAIVLIAAFIIIEMRSSNPLVPLRIFRYRSISRANVMAFMLAGAMNAQVIIITLYIQTVLGYSPQMAGLAELPSGISTFLIIALTARLVKRTSVRRLLFIGPLSYALGLIWIARLPTDGDYITAVFLPLEFLTIGMGITLPCLTIAATAGARTEESGLVSGIATTTRQIGGAIGVAVFGSIAATVTASSMAITTEKVALASGYRYGLLAAAAVSFVAAFLAFTLPADAEVQSAEVAADLPSRG